MKVDDKKKKLIMKRIEKKTEQQIAQNIVEGKITNPILEKDEKKQEQNQDILLKLMAEGGQEFRKETGRGMTYGEMREMYG
jgi:CRISPR/Cas system-associated endonuclease Cas1